MAERTYVCTPRNIQRLTVPDTIFAIGAFYTSFPSCEDDPHLHSKFFDLAMLFASDVMSDCTFDNVCTLLAQCFYLLATCQMERYTLSCHCYFRSLHGCRAWNILGLAIRMGQSIGLHVEDSPTENASDPIQREMRRRAWYSLYVLDRLLALQLGRPVAIHETEYHVSLPSEMADTGSDFASPGNCSVLNYFIQVIHFSQIAGSAITLYLQTHSEESLTSHTARLDESLLAWMTNLPRKLRFDLGHTFEKGGVFKKQVHQNSRSRGFLHSNLFSAQYARHQISPSPLSSSSTLPGPLIVSTLQNPLRATNMCL